MVSQELRIRTRSFSAVICFMAKASARVTARGRPSGTATMTSVTEMISIWVKVMPFSLAVSLGARGQLPSGYMVSSL